MASDLQEAASASVELSPEQRAKAAEALMRLELALLRIALHGGRIAMMCALLEGKNQTKH